MNEENKLLNYRILKDLKYRIMKLSKFELDIVAAAATDALEAAHEAKFEELKKSKIYSEFDSEYRDETSDQLRLNLTKILSLKSKVKELEDAIEKIEAESKNYLKEKNVYDKLPRSTYRHYETKDYLQSYLKMRKLELYPDAEFNRVKVLNDMSMQILTSPLKNPADFLTQIKESIENDR